MPGARLTGKVERHEKFGVFVFLAPGRTGLIPMSETGVAREADVARTFPVGADVEVVVLEVDPPGRRIRLSAKAVQAAHEAAEVREYAERDGCRAGGRLRIAGRQAPRRARATAEVRLPVLPDRRRQDPAEEKSEAGGRCSAPGCREEDDRRERSP